MGVLTGSTLYLFTLKTSKKDAASIQNARTLAYTVNEYEHLFPWKVDAFAF
mgnify:CR=1 FL=1